MPNAHDRLEDSIRKLEGAMFERSSEASEDSQGYIHSCIFKNVSHAGPRPHFSYKFPSDNGGAGRLQMYGLALMPIEQAVNLNDVPRALRWIVRRWCVGRIQ